MKIPHSPDNEIQRLAKLASLNIVYSPSEDRFDQITRIARELFAVPISLISLVAENTQWFKSNEGLMACETSRDISFCAHAILYEDTLVVPDTLENPDFADNPLVTGEPFIRFYAGHPIFFEGSPIGTLCIIDQFPRQMLAPDLDTLRSLARWVESELRVSMLSTTQTRLLSELDEVRRQALIDPLTKTWNRAGVELVLKEEMARASEEKIRVAVMRIELDDFAAFRERMGAVVGDVVLKEVARMIRASIRPMDMLARAHDHQFLVFMAGCTDDSALHFAKRIMSRMIDDPIRIVRDYPPVRPALSIALASMVGSDMREILQLTRDGLACARAKGGNCIEVSIPPASTKGYRENAR